ncbi:MULTISPECIES: hypothetical protein [Thalassolituus]|jgi:hypothetical protein|uniref:Uncharacterized protein n=1 Tax=hydrothermal vent metagenome TaxID=652676 RepID=A0A160TEA4_9ZZZZ|nr:hypothetical protein [Thalassolituus oleivorans]
MVDSVTKPKQKAPCTFCQRSRWLMVATILVVMMSVMFLNLGA